MRYNNKEYFALLTDLYAAYQRASLHKKNAKSRLEFEVNCEEELTTLAKEVLSGRYEISPCNCFITREPVVREIVAAQFRDRVIHHYIHDYLEPHLERYLIYDCYSCRKGKGTHFGVQRLVHHIHAASENYTRQCYALQLDIEGYFMHINKDMLYKKSCALMDKIREREGGDNREKHRLVGRLLEKVIYQDPLEKCIYRSPKSDWNDLPKSKSLHHSPKGCGLPIGNLTSQLFSNLYLNELDQFVKRELKVKHYGRYVDDFFLLGHDKEKLLSLVPVIDSFLEERLHLRLHPKKIRLQEVKKGVTFLGIHVKPFRRHLSRKTSYRIKKGVTEAEDELKRLRKLNANKVKTTAEQSKKIKLWESRISSYLGVLKWVNAHEMQTHVEKLYHEK